MYHDWCTVTTVSRKKDAIDIDSLGDYKELVAQLLKSEPSKLTVFLSLKDVKKAAKVFQTIPKGFFYE